MDGGVVDSAWQLGMTALVWALAIFLIVLAGYVLTEIVTWVKVHLL